MLYLEDFLDLIESLPLEMREKLTEVRELDLQVQNGLDNLGERSKNFFKQCSEARIAGQPRTEEYQKILSQYDDLLSIADDKVQLANNLHSIVQRFVSKLDQELLKFKMELEADNAGITEMLERRSRELDMTASTSRTERGRVALGDGRHAVPLSNSQYGGLNNSSLDIDTNLDISSFMGMITDSFDSFTPVASHHGPSSGGLAALLGPSSPGNVSEDLSIAPSSVAPSSISGDRKRKSDKNRRISNSGPNRIPSQIRQASCGSLSTATGRGGSSNKNKNRNRGGAGGIDYGNSNSPASVSSESLFGSIMDSSGIMADRPQVHQARRGVSGGSLPAGRGGGGSSSAANEDDEDGIETRWCICNDVSYGDMIMCDNKDCPIEWFHYGCVHITAAPRGRWYCPQCTAAMKRRANVIPGLAPVGSSLSLTSQPATSGSTSSLAAQLSTSSTNTGSGGGGRP